MGESRAGRSSPDGPGRVLHVATASDLAIETATALEAEAGLTVVTARTIAEALTSLDDGDIGCVVCDEVLLDATGIELLERVRTTAPEVPFFLVGQEYSEEVATGALDAGATDYQLLSDPAQIRLLATQVRRATRRDETEHVDSEGTYRAIFDETSDAIVLADDDAEYVEVNAAACELFGLPRSELLGRTVAEFAAEDFDFEAAWQAFQESDHDSGQFPLVRPDGTERIVEFTANPAIRPGINLSILRDVTEHQQLERKLDESERRFSMALEAAGAGIWEWDIETDEVGWHESCERLFGLEPGTFEGTYDGFARRVHPDDLQHVEEGLMAALDHGERFETEYRIVRDDGTERWIDSQGELLSDERGPTTTFVGVDVDVTERKEREQHLRVFDRVLRHNIRNDLNVISSYAELIDAQTSGEIAEYGRRIHRQSEKLLTTSDKERAIASILTTPPDIGRVDVGAHVRRTVDVARDHHSTASISLEASPSVTAVTTDRFDEALAELVENAVVHNDRDHPTVDLAVSYTDERVRIQVTDDGPPIPEMNVGVLTGEKAVDQVYHGSGLGLWLVNWIVVRSGGQLSFDENTPRGNVITLTLPRAAAGSDQFEADTDVDDDPDTWSASSGP